MPGLTSDALHLVQRLALPAPAGPPTDPAQGIFSDGGMITIKTGGLFSSQTVISSNGVGAGRTHAQRSLLAAARHQQHRTHMLRSAVRGTRLQETHPDCELARRVGAAHEVGRQLGDGDRQRARLADPECRRRHEHRIVQMHCIRIAPHAAEQVERDRVALEVRAQRARVVHANRSDQEIAQRAGEDLRARTLIQHRRADPCSGQIPPDTTSTDCPGSVPASRRELTPRCGPTRHRVSGATTRADAPPSSPPRRRAGDADQLSSTFDAEMTRDGGARSAARRHRARGGANRPDSSGVEQSEQVMSFEDGRPSNRRAGDGDAVVREAHDRQSHVQRRSLLRDKRPAHRRRDEQAVQHRGEEPEHLGRRLGLRFTRGV